MQKSNDNQHNEYSLYETLKFIKSDGFLPCDYQSNAPQDFINNIKNIYLNRQKCRKKETYIRSYLCVGDIYYSVYDNKLILLKIISIGSTYFSDVIFELIEDDDIIELISENTKYITNSMINMDVSLLKTNNLFVTKKNNISLCLNLYESDFKIKSKPHLGIFKNQYHNGKIYSINSFHNEQDVIIGKEVTRFFEPYFVITVNKNPESGINTQLIFRKTKDDMFGIIQALRVSNKLIVDAENLSCAYSTPYFIIENINREYTNRINRKYNLELIVRKISEKLCSYSRDFSLQNVFDSVFNPYYQKELKDEEKVIGFSKMEIKEILDKYFIFDVTLGLYYSCDTWIKKDNMNVLIDRKWFEIFYNSVKKNKVNCLNKISDLTVPKRDFEYFVKFSLSSEDIDKFLKLVHKHNDFESFFENINYEILKNSNFL